ncbi:pyridoxamine 5'-phosphate oxidase [Ornithinimicrobium sp. INDO-MA30-4]|uniref:pyridoxamine 5'-phosphate oxidase n=1 Tax=Ornithinimicrobium sp. INDO-MA30-4 TaxID=2908651 RepID=UPI001F2E5940|nr:pyridoxamine 5'-phosphate oxidase [Ornithinimicrobium sp. INDO-MA30-4]UJH70531.1 pyridoxamine 5'-phosphate oxidase [Ornithinimicrobium sp. INDO-MA30-4]
MGIQARTDYNSDGLDEDTFASSPLAQIQEWVDAALQQQEAKGNVPEPMAIHLATVDADGFPDVRTVLMRLLEGRGLAFFTNIDSAKGQQIRAQDHVAAALVWPSMFRAIRFRGVAVPVSREDVLEYHQSRPYGSRIGAWASAQSQVAATREVVHTAYRELEERFPDHGNVDDVPLPEHWGGWWIEPTSVEFWAGRRSRLHDRLRLTRTGSGDLSDLTAWTMERLQP